MWWLLLTQEGYEDYGESDHSRAMVTLLLDVRNQLLAAVALGAAPWLPPCALAHGAADVRDAAEADGVRFV